MAKTDDEKAATRSSAQERRDILKRLKFEYTWIKQATVDWGTLLIDPYTIALNNQNPGLKRAFQESGLDRKNSDHWKFLLAAVVRAIYEKSTVRKKKWNPKLEREFFLGVSDRRISTSKPSVSDICSDMVRTGAVSGALAYTSIPTLANKHSVLLRSARKCLAKRSDFLTIDHDMLSGILAKFPKKRRGKRSRS
ncbi:MAG: hypothetical protein NTZ72_13720 [Afipia sp.]|nr:hypothetical protein [Afipia sp.]